MNWYTVVVLLAAGLLVYTYLGLELGFAVAARRWNSSGPTPAPLARWPSVSIIVAAYNEEQTIGAKLANLEALAYPGPCLEIVIACDGCTDRTAAIARQSQSQAVRVLEFPRNRGRAAVHNDAVAASTGEIMLFTDAETEFAPDFLLRVVPYLADPRYGCGSGDYSFRTQGAVGEAEGFYWRHEKKLRELEYRLGVLPFASGGCFLVPRALFSPVPEHLDIDNFLPLLLVARGYRVFYAKQAKAWDVTASGARLQMRKRVRSTLHGMRGITGGTLAALRAGKWMIAFVVVSHRLLRWLGAYLLLALLTSSIAGAMARHSPLLILSLWAQFAFYTLGAYGALSSRWPRLPRTAVTDLVYSFLLANAAFLWGTIKLLRGDRVGGWNKDQTRADIAI